jgi:predicted enzyme related to lactoylglutathione lyase
MNNIMHFEILGKDKQLLEGFYKSVFGWRIAPVMPDYSMAIPDSGISGGIGAMGEARSHVTFYVAVSDLQTTLATIEAQGGKLAYGPQTLPDGAIFAGFTDPEGHLIGLIQPHSTSR